MLDKLKNTVIDSVSSLVGSVGKAIDDNITSDEERNILRNKLKELENQELRIVNDSINSYESEVTQRWVSDNKADSWFTKNIRPLVLLLMVISWCVVAISSIFVDFTMHQSTMVTNMFSSMNTFLSVIVSAYFGARTVEKVKIK